jgi:hypothetical protein
MGKKVGTERKERSPSYTVSCGAASRTYARVHMMRALSGVLVGCLQLVEVSAMNRPIGLLEFVLVSAEVIKRCEFEGHSSPSKRLGTWYCVGHLGLFQV